MGFRRRRTTSENARTDAEGSATDIDWVADVHRISPTPGDKLCEDAPRSSPRNPGESSYAPKLRMFLVQGTGARWQILHS